MWRGILNAAQRLKLKLSVENLDAPEKSISCFYQVVTCLVQQAIGDHATSEIEHRLQGGDEFSLLIGQRHISLEKKTWETGKLRHADFTFVIDCYEGYRPIYEYDP